MGAAVSSNKARSERLTPGDDSGADYYILLCARRYADTLQKLLNGIFGGT